MIRSILKSIYDRAKSIVLISVLALILLPGCYTAWDFDPEPYPYPPSTVVIDGGSYWYGGAWWYGYNGGWHRHHQIQVWQPNHRHSYYVAPRPSSNVRTEHQSQGRTHGNRR